MISVLAEPDGDVIGVFENDLLKLVDEPMPLVGVEASRLLREQVVDAWLREPAPILRAIRHIASEEERKNSKHAFAVATPCPPRAPRSRPRRPKSSAPDERGRNPNGSRRRACRIRPTPPGTPSTSPRRRSFRHGSVSTGSRRTNVSKAWRWSGSRACLPDGRTRLNYPEDAEDLAAELASASELIGTTRPQRRGDRRGCIRATRSAARRRQRAACAGRRACSQ